MSMAKIIKKNKKNVMKFYDLMFNQCGPYQKNPLTTIRCPDFVIGWENFK